MKRFVSFFQSTCIAVFMLLSIGCSSEKQPQSSCAENIPDKIAGLEIAGPRSEDNIKKNLWPMTCEILRQYTELTREKKGLKGRFLVEMVIDPTGEVGRYVITADVSEPAPELKALLETFIINFEFDAWMAPLEDTEIIWPIVLKRI